MRAPRPGGPSLLRVALTLALIALATPTAAALGPVAPRVSVALGPEGLAHPEEGESYYLWATLAAPERPRAADGSEDCARGERPGPLAAAARLADELRAYDPLRNIAFSSWFPRCLAADAARVCPGGIAPCPPAPARAYVAYDVATGVYYVEAGAPELLGANAASLAITGSSGAGLVADCAACPQPP